MQAKIILTFTFTKNYPDEIPEIIIDETENIRDENDVIEFLKKLVTTHFLNYFEKSSNFLWDKYFSTSEIGFSTFFEKGPKYAGFTTLNF